MRGHNAVLNACDVNSAGVLATAGDDGSLRLWDYRTGYNFQRLETVAQPGSLACEAGIYDCAFDRSGTRLITCEADKTVKIWKEQAEADPESHPIDMASWTAECRRRRWGFSSPRVPSAGVMMLGFLNFEPRTRSYRLPATLHPQCAYS